jgi:hypothetical protein
MFVGVFLSFCDFENSDPQFLIENGINNSYLSVTDSPEIRTLQLFTAFRSRVFNQIIDRPGCPDLVFLAKSQNLFLGGWQYNYSIRQVFHF